mmetsp:Transcript_1434/g.3180  ORF Transcript_1434/g.3180 Transcript_1434/m.3180 type:complete len:284 (-) Transcript_1434:365-1216(-)
MVAELIVGVNVKIDRSTSCGRFVCALQRTCHRACGTSNDPETLRLSDLHPQTGQDLEVEHISRVFGGLASPIDPELAVVMAPVLKRLGDFVVQALSRQQASGGDLELSVKMRRGLNIFADAVLEDHVKFLLLARNDCVLAVLVRNDGLEPVSVRRERKSVRVREPAEHRAGLTDDGVAADTRVENEGQAIRPLGAVHHLVGSPPNHADVDPPPCVLQVALKENVSVAAQALHVELQNVCFVLYVCRLACHPKLVGGRVASTDPFDTRSGKPGRKCCGCVVGGG